MKLKILFVCVLIVVSYWPEVQAACGAEDLQTVRCIYDIWKDHPGHQTLARLVDSLFYTYITDGMDPTLRKFFDGIRVQDQRFSGAPALLEQIVSRYSFKRSYSFEIASIWAMQPQDARRLFLLSQTDPSSVSFEISAAMYLAVYEEIDRYFSLNAFRKNERIAFPNSEYERLLTILNRMNRIQDPFLLGMNSYYRGLVWMNLRHPLEGIPLLSRSKEAMRLCMSQAKEKLSRKRILSVMASADILLNDPAQAEAEYLAILKLDPQDWGALMDLSYLLNRRGECLEPGIWVEALIRPNEELFEITIHCGNRELPEKDFPETVPVLARARFDSYSVRESTRSDFSPAAK